MTKTLKFSDLFCGIGGFHLALKELGLKCVFSSDIDGIACDTYEANFGARPSGDITKTDASSIPAYDVLCAGFPCQPFSITGKQEGFDDPTRGTLFHEIIRIAKHHRPKVLFLENVANFERHDGGRSLRIVADAVAETGYDFHYAMLNACHYGFPTARERVYMLGFRKDLGVGNFSFPKPTMQPVRLLDFLDVDADVEELRIRRDGIKLGTGRNAGPDLWGNDTCEVSPIQIGVIHYRNMQGYRVYSPLGPAITFSATGGGSGSKTGAYLINGVVRRLSAKEALWVMGYPKTFVLKGTVTQQYHQIGNSVVVGMVRTIFGEVLKALDKPSRK